jgi:hypothetical protein
MGDDRLRHDLAAGGYIKPDHLIPDVILGMGREG